MTNLKYICLNGEFRRTSEPFLSPQNRTFRFGDALCENIHVYATDAQFLAQHFTRLTGGMSLLKMDIPGWLSLDYLAHLIKQLLNRNRLFGGGYIRLTLFRDAGVFITPDNNRVSLLLESHSLPYDFYVLNEKGFAIDLCRDYHLHGSSLSGLKSTGSLLYVMTGLYCKQNNLDDAVLLNEAGRIAGSSRYNIFLVRANSIFTPGLNQGCINGIMRKVIIELSEDYGLKVNDQSSLTPAVLDDADEVFLTNAMDGIRWVGAFRQRRYYKKTAQLLTRLLNGKAFGRTGPGKYDQFI